ncbi:MAG: GNAT family N-acetyltransferase [Planctomycetia bacterium]|nr:GNAT family N-acetyltransferase [Planctomycetia bacterium]
MQHPYLIGEKVYLRPLDKADAARCVSWVNDPAVTRNLMVYRPLNLQAEEQFIERATQDEHSLILAIVVRANDLHIGNLSFENLDFRSRSAAFGIVIGEKAEWGKGYGTEATRLLLQHGFHTLNLNRVWLHVYEYNAAALRVYQKLGFQREGTLRQDTYRDGRYWDTIVMGLLRAEWEEQFV